MKKTLIISISFCLLLLLGCGHRSKQTSKLLYLKRTPVSAFDLALVRAEAELKRILYIKYMKDISLAVVYREEKNIIDIVVSPGEFTTNKEKAEEYSDIYFFVENEEQAQKKLEEVFMLTIETIGTEGHAYSHFLHEIGGPYFKKNQKEICQELEKITKVNVNAFYREGNDGYKLHVNGTLDGKRDYSKTKYIIKTR
ncbi:hypothetical protein ACFL2O_08285 [Thermodesulfobacteriota bacterium]